MGGGIGTMTEEKIDMEGEIDMVAVIGMEEEIAMVAVTVMEVVIGMGTGEEVTGMEGRDMERTGMEEDLEGQDPLAHTTGSRDQGGISDPDPGAMRDLDTKQ